MYENHHFGELDEDVEAPSLWLLLPMCTHLYSIYNRSTYKINITSQGDLSCRSLKVCHCKPACPPVITDVKAAEKLRSWSYNLAVTTFSKEAVFFFTAVHHNWDLSFLFHFFCIPGSSCECYVFSTFEFKRLIPRKAFLPNYRLIKHLTFARIGLFNKYRLLGPRPE